MKDQKSRQAWPARAWESVSAYVGRRWGFGAYRIARSLPLGLALVVMAWLVSLAASGSPNG